MIWFLKDRIRCWVHFARTAFSSETVFKCSPHTCYKANDCCGAMVCGAVVCDAVVCGAVVCGAMVCGARCVVLRWYCAKVCGAKMMREPVRGGLEEVGSLHKICQIYKFWIINLIFISYFNIMEVHDVLNFLLFYLT